MRQYVRLLDNDAFDFPVATNGHYRPIGISAPGSTSDAFTAEHRNEDSNTAYPHSSRDSTINGISTNEYWLLDRNAGTSDITVTLSWDDMSCSFDTLANLRMVAWDTSSTAKWKDLGNGGTTGDSLVGTMNSNGASTVYGAYALATVDTFGCVPCRADAGVDLSIYYGDSLRIGGTNPNGTSFSWIPTSGLNDANLETPITSPLGHQIYVLEVTNSNGCKAKDPVQIWMRLRPTLPNCLVH